MPQSQKDLGAIVSVHGTSAVFLQRAAIIAVLSFFFFMAMLVVFYVRQQMVYFVLSTAFLVVYIFTLVGWVMQKRNTVSIYENGIGHRSFVAAWDEIQSVKADAGAGINIVKTNGQSVTIPKTITGVDQIAMVIRNHLT
jgi:ABC-type bacteriocin/lantibiotic exporter with double-glycine peptidase domain